MALQITKSKNETVLLAQQFAKTLRPGDLILFNGGLGCGKTAFCSGIAQGLGITDVVQSPTFSIANVYNGEYTFVHFDFYRLTSEQDLEMAGFYDYLNSGAIVAGEWAQRLIEINADIPEPTYIIDMQIISENERKIQITSGGAL